PTRHASRILPRPTPFVLLGTYNRSWHATARGGDSRAGVRRRSEPASPRRRDAKGAAGSRRTGHPSTTRTPTPSTRPPMAGAAARRAAQRLASTASGILGAQRKGHG